MLEQLYALGFVASEFTEGLCLLLKGLSDGFKRVAAFELSHEWVFRVDEVYPRLFFILLQGRPKKQL